MRDIIITIGYFLFCCYGIVSGILLYVSPEKYWRFLNYFVIVGRVPELSPQWVRSRRTRVVGLLLTLGFLWMATVPLLWQLFPNPSTKQALNVPTPPAANFDWVAVLGIVFLSGLGAFMIWKPRSYLRLASKRGAAVFNEDTKSAAGLWLIRALGGALFLGGLYFVFSIL